RGWRAPRAAAVPCPRAGQRWLDVGEFGVERRGEIEDRPRTKDLTLGRIRVGRILVVEEEAVAAGLFTESSRLR
ncbi:hypothetical protein GS942_26810, partial [Rhodococcus hoagii]|nr:hypothetical protein [Prescottella equi]